MLVVRLIAKAVILPIFSGSFLPSMIHTDIQLDTRRVNLFKATCTHCKLNNVPWSEFIIMSRKALVWILLHVLFEN
ncbi:hypothetical protein DFP73DRAFT_564924 [Morchella snyderi]|nr:hypothetical protein DFP73DRAFT_564924 [Morchella snyderi]